MKLITPIMLLVIIAAALATIITEKIAQKEDKTMTEQVIITIGRVFRSKFWTKLYVKHKQTTISVVVFACTFT